MLQVAKGMEGTTRKNTMYYFLLKYLGVRLSWRCVKIFKSITLIPQSCGEVCFFISLSAREIGFGFINFHTQVENYYSLQLTQIPSLKRNIDFASVYPCIENIKRFVMVES